MTVKIYYFGGTNTPYVYISKSPGNEFGLSLPFGISAFTCYGP